MKLHSDVLYEIVKYSRPKDFRELLDLILKFNGDVYFCFKSLLKYINEYNYDYPFHVFCKCCKKGDLINLKKLHKIFNFDENVIKSRKLIFGYKALNLDILKWLHKKFNITIKNIELNFCDFETLKWLCETFGKKEIITKNIFNKLECLNSIKWSIKFLDINEKNKSFFLNLYKKSIITHNVDMLNWLQEKYRNCESEIISILTKYSYYITLNFLKHFNEKFTIPSEIVKNYFYIPQFNDECLDIFKWIYENFEIIRQLPLSEKIHIFNMAIEKYDVDVLKCLRDTFKITKIDIKKINAKIIRNGEVLKWLYQNFEISRNNIKSLVKDFNYGFCDSNILEWLHKNIILTEEEANYFFQNNCDLETLKWFNRNFKIDENLIEQKFEFAVEFDNLETCIWLYEISKIKNKTFENIFGGDTDIEKLKWLHEKFDISNTCEDFYILSRDIKIIEWLYKNFNFMTKEYVRSKRILINLIESILNFSFRHDYINIGYKYEKILKWFCETFDMVEGEFKYEKLNYKILDWNMRNRPEKLILDEKFII